MRFGWRDSVSELRVHCCSDSGHSVTWCKTDQPSEPTKNGAEREGPQFAPWVLRFRARRTLDGGTT